MTQVPASSHGGLEVASGALVSLQTPLAGVGSGAMTMDTEEQDTDGYWAGAQPSRFAIPTGLGGLFVVTVYAQFAADVTLTGGETYLIPSGAAPNAYGAMYKDLLGASVWRGTCTAILYATAGQNISFQAAGFGAATWTLAAGCFASIARIGSLA